MASKLAGTELTSRTESRRVPLRRLWAFRAIAMALPVVFLVVVELMLRFFWLWP